MITDVIKKRIVIGLEDLCELTGHRMCHRLALASARLDERWRLGLWKIVDESNEVE